jgi:hypothetical protein
MSPSLKLCLFSAALVFAPTQGLLAEDGKPFLIIGTSKDASDTNQPRPAQTKYFRTYLGGFQVIQGFAGYAVFVDLIEKPSRKLYTRAILQNPLDPQAPFVYDHFIDSTTSRTTLSHRPVMGLEINKDYDVELIVYEDEARTREIDRLHQPVRSYVDTTGPEIKVIDGVQEKPSPPSADEEDEEEDEEQVSERWSFDFDSPKWKLGHQEAKGGHAIREYVQAGETVEDWSALVTSLYDAREAEPKALMETMRSTLSRDCPSLRLAVVEESADDVLFEWHHQGCHGFPPEHEIRRIARSGSGIVSLSYAEKTADLPEERRAVWLSILQAAKPTAEDAGAGQ